ncbi:MAG: hypothetical protein M1812_005812 [Candelaria pacifica]|nr:MAG: hypothetical protein M1812_005812 [Candelaria pacifica]
MRFINPPEERIEDTAEQGDELLEQLIMNNQPAEEDAEEDTREDLPPVAWREALNSLNTLRGYVKGQEGGNKQLLKLLEKEETTIQAQQAATKKQSSLDTFLFTVERHRPSVASLVEVPFNRIQLLLQLLDDARRNFSEKLEESGHLTVLNTYSSTLLADLAIPESFTLDKSGPVLWRTIVDILNLGLLSYSGAHVVRFDMLNFKKTIDKFHISSPAMAGPTPLIFHQRSLRCLEEFFGKQMIWCFEFVIPNNCSISPIRPSLGHKSPEYGLLVLCMTETFAQLWGPARATCRRNNREEIFRISVGSGVILPWEVGEGEPRAKERERYCHWIPITDYDGTMRAAPLRPTDQLLAAGH